MPAYSHTEPHLTVQPHVGMARTDTTVSNIEEVKPRRAKSELSLVVFTLLGQMAAGIAVLSLFSGPLSLSVLIALGGLIGVGGLASFLHLGTPLNAWRALNHLNKSWLSREILMFGFLGGSWLIALALPGMGRLPIALCGTGLVYSMAQVYRLRSVPAWDSDRTLLSFAVSAALLGALGLQILDTVGNTGPSIGYQFVSGGALVGALWLSLTERDSAHQTVNRLRLGLIALAGLGMVMLFILPDTVGRWIILPVFLIVLSEEAIGRWSFYEHVNQRIL